MTATESATHADAAALAEGSRREALETLNAAEQGHFAKILTERWSPDVTLFDGRQPAGGREFLVRGMECDLEAGVRQRFVGAVASSDTIIWEMELVTGPGTPSAVRPR
jgi:RNA polymerase sigma-70 factor (ECF subfamily)